MKRGMTIEYLKCRADLNFEVDFRANGAIGTIVTKWDPNFLDNGSFLSLICIFLYTHHMLKFQSPVAHTKPILKI